MIQNFDFCRKDICSTSHIHRLEYEDQYLVGDRVFIEAYEEESSLWGISSFISTIMDVALV